MRKSEVREVSEVREARRRVLHDALAHPLHIVPVGDHATLHRAIQPHSALSQKDLLRPGAVAVADHLGVRAGELIPQGRRDGRPSDAVEESANFVIARKAGPHHSRPAINHNRPTVDAFQRLDVFVRVAVFHCYCREFGGSVESMIICAKMKSMTAENISADTSSSTTSGASESRMARRSRGPETWRGVTAHSLADLGLVAVTVEGQ